MHTFPCYAAADPAVPAWEPTAASRDRFRALLPGVMAFRVRVRTEQSIFKLSQDLDAERYSRVRDAAAARDPGLAEQMRSAGGGAGGGAGGRAGGRAGGTGSRVKS